MTRWLLSLALIYAMIFCCGCACDSEDDCDDCDCDDDQDDEAPDMEECQNCHISQVAAWEHPSSHSALYDCEFCHVEIYDEPVSGHRTVPWCDNCHSEQTHNPTYFQGDFQLISCTTCHEPHGSPNLFLMQRAIPVSRGETAEVEFTNLDGMAEGSFVQPGNLAGTGLCEVCHEGTTYYNRDGNGQDHFTSRCTDCHDHALGFAR